MPQHRAPLQPYSAGKAIVGALACTLLLLPLFAASLLLVRGYTDVEAVRRNIAAAYEQGVLGVDEVPRQFVHRYGHQFTECTALEVALDDQKDLVRATLVPQLHSRFVAPCRDLLRDALGVDSGERTDYSRYWHGYRVYLWPMLGHMSLAAMRLCNAVIALGAVLFFHRSLARAIGGPAAAVLVLGMLFLTDIWRIWRITPHFLSMLVILAGSGAFARLYAERRDPTLAIVLAAALGAVFNFVDFLVNPPMLPMLLAFIVLAIEAPRRPAATRREWLQALRLPALVTASWFGAYLLTWAAKWLIAVAVADDPWGAIFAILEQIRLRLYGQEVDNVVPIVPMLPTLKMVAQSLLAIGVVPFAALTAAVLVHVRGHRQHFATSRFLLLATPALIPVAWFEALSNHTQTHSHFTYRTLAVALAMLLAAAVLSLETQPSLEGLLKGLRRARPSSNWTGRAVTGLPLELPSEGGKDACAGRG